MNKIIFIFSMIFLIAQTCWADKYYLFIQKNDDGDDIPVEQKNYSGDVVSFSPYVPRYKPTQAEYDRYQIIVADLTQDDLLLLTQEKKETRLITETVDLKKEMRDTAIDNLTNEFPDLVVTGEQDLGDKVKVTSQYTKEVRVGLRSENIDLESLKITKQEQEVTKNALFKAMDTKFSIDLDVP